MFISLPFKKKLVLLWSVMSRLTYKTPIGQAVSLRKNGGGIFEALLHYSFLIGCLLLLFSLPVSAQMPEGKMITVTKDTIICWADSDGCYNYILQASSDGTGNVLRKANGKQLRAGNKYFHTPYDVTKEPNGDAALQQLIAQEANAFRLETNTFLSKYSSYLYYLLGVVVWFIGMWVWHWTKRRYSKM